MSTRKEKGIRLTFTIEELRGYYAYLGGQVGFVEDRGAINNQRPSEYADTVLVLRKMQDKIATAIREYQADQEAELVQPTV